MNLLLLVHIPPQTVKFYVNIDDSIITIHFEINIIFNYKFYYECRTIEFLNSQNPINTISLKRIFHSKIEIFYQNAYFAAIRQNKTFLAITINLKRK